MKTCLCCEGDDPLGLAVILSSDITHHKPPTSIKLYLYDLICQEGNNSKERLPLNRQKPSRGLFCCPPGGNVCTLLCFWWLSGCDNGHRHMLSCSVENTLPAPQSNLHTSQGARSVSIHFMKTRQAPSIFLFRGKSKEALIYKVNP